MDSLSTRSFSWYGPTGVAEMSDLQLTSYPDKLLLESAQTGDTVIFEREHQEIDSEGDLLFTRYVSTRPVQGRQPCLVIWND